MNIGRTNAACQVKRGTPILQVAPSIKSKSSVHDVPVAAKLARLRLKSYGATSQSEGGPAAS